MAKKYFYGEDARCFYIDNDLKAAVHTVIRCKGYDAGTIITIAEMTSSKVAGRYCIELDRPINGHEDCCGCDKKEFIGISYHCKHKTYGFVKTGAKWEYEITHADIRYNLVYLEIDSDRIKKISGRKK